MSTLISIRQRFIDLQGQFETIVGESMDEKGQEAANFNAKQLSEGLKTNGVKSNFVYAFSTVKSKQGMAGLAGVTDHLTNYNTGDSYNNLYQRVAGNKVIFGTTTDKEDAISKRMNNLAFGLTAENKSDYLKQDVNPLFIDKIKTFLSNG